MTTAKGIYLICTYLFDSFLEVKNALVHEHMLLKLV